MNKNQKRVVLIAVLIVAGMLLFPPWRHNWKSIVPLPGGTPTESRSSGYALLFRPPRTDAYVDVSRLLLQVGIVAVLAYGACVSLSRTNGE